MPGPTVAVAASTVCTHITSFDMLASMFLTDCWRDKGCKKGYNCEQERLM
jgi:hypothetical protein